MLTHDAVARAGLASTSRLGRFLLRDIGAPVEGTIVSAAVITVTATHAASLSRIIVAWAFVLVIYWLTHVYLHALQEQLGKQADRLHHRLANHASLQAGVLVGGLPVMVVFLIAVAFGASQSTSLYFALIWTIVQLAGTVFVASRAARLSRGRALVESAAASLLGFALVAAKVFMH